MKKYNIEISVETPEAYRGNKPWNGLWYTQGEQIEAESEADAVDTIVEYFAQEARDNGYECEVEGDHILVYEDGELSQVEYYRVEEKR